MCLYYEAIVALGCSTESVSKNLRNSLYCSQSFLSSEEQLDNTYFNLQLSVVMSLLQINIKSDLFTLVDRKLSSLAFGDFQLYIQSGSESIESNYLQKNPTNTSI